jgi:uncharacterized protein YndB with AHSA1/START domain
VSLSNLEIRKTIDVDAPTDVVFRALTDEKELVKWLPQEAKMDARVGGQLQFKYRREGRANELVFEGEVLELVQDRKVSYTYHFPKVNPGQVVGPAPNTVVTWTLDGLPDGRTRVTVVHTGFFTGLAKYAEEGWEHNLSLLAQYCRGAFVSR